MSQPDHSAEFRAVVIEAAGVLHRATDALERAAQEADGRGVRLRLQTLSLVVTRVFELLLATTGRPPEPEPELLRAATFVLGPDTFMVRFKTQEPPGPAPAGETG